MDMASDIDKVAQLAQIEAERRGRSDDVPHLRHARRTTLAANLRAIDDRNFVAPANAPDLFGVINPRDHSLPYLFTLTSYLRHGRTRFSAVEFARKCVEFANNCDPEDAWSAPDKLNELAHGLGAVADYLNRPDIAISPLRLLLVRSANIDGDNHRLTHIHQLFLKYCLLSKNYAFASSILDADINIIRTPLRIQDFLLYYYYGGMVYVGLKNFARAVNFFAVCISAPAVVTSMIQIEAYRKYVLVSILHSGSVAPLPKYTSQVVMRVVQNHSSQYIDFAKAFESGGVGRLQSEFAKSQEVFQKSRNLGLARQCLAAHARRAIINLTQTYLTLSLVDMARSVGIEGPNAVSEVEMEVLRLVDEGKVFATISHADGGMVSFFESPHHYDDEATLQRLENDMGMSVGVISRLKQLDKVIELSKEYQSKVARGGSAALSGTGVIGGSDGHRAHPERGSSWIDDDMADM